MPTSCVPIGRERVPKESSVTEDAVLGGRLRLKQPTRGHRVGHDAILLAAATEAYAGEHVVEFSYRPRSLQLGAAVSALALVCVAGALYWAYKRT